MWHKGGQDAIQDTLPYRKILLRQTFYFNKGLKIIFLYIYNKVIRVYDKKKWMIWAELK